VRLGLVAAIAGCYEARDDGAACECECEEAKAPTCDDSTSAADEERDTAAVESDSWAELIDTDAYGQIEDPHRADTAPLLATDPEQDTEDSPYPETDSDTVVPVADTDDPCYIEQRDKLRNDLRDNCEMQQHFDRISIEFNENGFVSDFNVDINSDVTEYIEELIACYMDLLLTAQFPCLGNREIVVHP
jgi:hypothetical protein